MPRLKCKKCGKVFETSAISSVTMIHAGPYNLMKCPACGARSWFNFFSSVKEPVTWPEQPQAPVEPKLSAEELEKKRIEDSKYETS